MTGPAPDCRGTTWDDAKELKLNKRSRLQARACERTGPLVAAVALAH
jgi:hypothetical protein